MIRKRIAIMGTCLALALSIIGLGAPAYVAAMPNTTVVADSSFKQDACNGLSSISSADSCGNASTTSTFNIIKNVINLLSMLVGVVAVIMFIVGGFRYITSAGDSSKVSSAKNTLVYAIIGLVVVALAQAIVLFVLNKVAK